MAFPWFTRSAPAPAAPEQRGASAFEYGPGFASLATLAASAGAVSPRMAENLSAVSACVHAVSSGIATLPAYVFRADGPGRVEAPGHPVARLLRQPNRNQTWCDFAEWLVAQMLLHGNGVAVIDRDGAARPVALRPIPWPAVQVQVLPSGRLAYDVVGAVNRRYLDSDVLHLRDRSDDGVVGRSRLSRAPAVLQAAMGLQTFAQAIWDNAATPSAVFGMPSGISADGIRRFRSHVDEVYTGAHNAKKVVLADAGITVTPLSVSPEDAEVLASRQFTVIEIARLFNVPPPIIQDYSNSTFTNASQASTWFAQNTLAPIARKIEAEFSRSLFTDSSHHLEIDLSGLLRGDYTARWAANVAAVQAGILTADEVRAQEGYSPLPREPHLPNGPTQMN